MSMSHRMSRRSAINEAHTLDVILFSEIEISGCSDGPAPAGSPYKRVDCSCGLVTPTERHRYNCSLLEPPITGNLQPHVRTHFRQSCAREDRADVWRPGPGLGAHPPRLEGFFVHRAERRFVSAQSSDHREKRA